MLKRLEHVLISCNENIFQLRQTARHVMSRYYVLTGDNESLSRHYE